MVLCSVLLFFSFGTRKNSDRRCQYPISCTKFSTIRKMFPGMTYIINVEWQLGIFIWTFNGVILCNWKWKFSDLRCILYMLVFSSLFQTWHHWKILQLQSLNCLINWKLAMKWNCNSESFWNFRYKYNCTSRTRYVCKISNWRIQQGQKSNLENFDRF